MQKTDNIIYLYVFLIFAGAGLLVISINYLFNRENSHVEKTKTTLGKDLKGIDVSRYQGRINWKKIKENHRDIVFVFIRATMGRNGIDKEFARNWRLTKKYGFYRGAYHYFRPDEPAEEQFRNFKRMVKLEEDDLIPVLDIEKMSSYGHRYLLNEIKTWLRLAEEEYGVKPIVYTSAKFYETYLHGHLDDYPLWIAAYSGSWRIFHIDWDFHQFTDQLKIHGINHYVDGNIFKGSGSEFEKFLMKNARPGAD